MSTKPATLSAPNPAAAMEFTKRFLRAKNPCANGFRWFVRHIEDGTSYQEALDTLVQAGRVGDACWLLSQFGPTSAVLSLDRLEAERAAKVQTLIGAAAGDLLRAPLTTIRTVEQMRADQRHDGPSDAADEIPPEIARQLMRDHLDKHYRETLDAPIPALGGKSPRQAVRTAAGRAKVIDWLKMLENRSAGHGEGPIAEYDFGWMWGELGLQEHRK